MYIVQESYCQKIFYNFEVDGLIIFKMLENRSAAVIFLELRFHFPSLFNLHYLPWEVQNLHDLFLCKMASFAISAKAALVAQVNKFNSPPGFVMIKIENR